MASNRFTGIGEGRKPSQDATQRAMAHKLMQEAIEAAHYMEELHGGSKTVLRVLRAEAHRQRKMVAEYRARYGEHAAKVL